MWDLFRTTLTNEPPISSGDARAAVLAPLFEDDTGEMRLLLTKRPMTMPTHAGHLAFPGGRPDPGDAGPLDTALRETHEEIGVPPQDVQILGYLPQVDTVQFSLMVVPVVGRLPNDPVIVPSKREVDKVLVPRVVDLLDESGWRSEDWMGRNVWFFDVDGEVLWGATAWMTRRLLGMPA
jgi:8-oxo-dGTP pyrophosphatase MutT (NUDIX family)